MTRNHSRVTGTLRLLLSLWLVATAVRTLADPQQAVAESGMPMGSLLPWAGISFSVGIFLLSGFMSRVCGLVLLAMGVWYAAMFGMANVAPVLLIVTGIYLALRGGGAWAMDIYVQKMQDKVRMRDAANSPESTSPPSRA